MNKKIMIIIFFIILLDVIFMPYISFADIDTSGYTKIYDSPTGVDSLFDKGGKVLGVVQAAGIGIAVIVLTVIGIKYFTASVEEKAQLKETLIPYFIGAVLLFGGTTILSLVVNFVREIGNSI